MEILGKIMMLAFAALGAVAFVAMCSCLLCKYEEKAQQKKERDKWMRISNERK